MYEDLLEISSKCLQCKNANCMKACPLKTDIPQMIKLFKNKDYLAAYELLNKNNIFSSICCKICPVEKQCEGNCVKKALEGSIKISEIENFINCWAIENNIKLKVNKKENKNKNIAIIGSGPAGLSCAYELLKEGYGVTIFEKNEKLGGILRYGIPDFRLEKSLLDNTISVLTELGLKVKKMFELEKNITIENLKDEYSAILIGIGAQVPTSYKLCDEKIKNIYLPNDFLKSYADGNKIEKLGKTIVIGGGNVAIDCALVSKKLGADTVNIIYRRDETRIPARKYEIQELLSKNIEIMYKTKVIKANIKNNKISNVECLKTKIVNEKVVEIENSNFIIEVDSIIYAIGLTPDTELLKELKLEIENDLLKVDENNMTNIDGIFACGDITENKSNVSRAIASGKKSANSIIKYIERKQNAGKI